MPVQPLNHTHFMKEALRLASQAAYEDEVPVGALLVREGLILGQGYNQMIGRSDPTAHAEIMALRDASQYFGNYRLPQTTLYVTLEPCLMCFGALVLARVATLVYGAPDPKRGFSRFIKPDDHTHLHHHMTIMTGVMADACCLAITQFFQTKRERGKRKWLRRGDPEP